MSEEEEKKENEELINQNNMEIEEENFKRSNEKKEEIIQEKKVEKSCELNQENEQEIEKQNLLKKKENEKLEKSTEKMNLPPPTPFIQAQIENMIKDDDINNKSKEEMKNEKTEKNNEEVRKENQTFKPNESEPEKHDKCKDYCETLKEICDIFQKAIIKNQNETNLKTRQNFVEQKIDNINYIYDDKDNNLLGKKRYRDNLSEKKNSLESNSLYNNEEKEKEKDKNSNIEEKNKLNSSPNQSFDKSNNSSQKNNSKNNNIKRKKKKIKKKKKILFKNKNNNEILKKDTNKNKEEEDKKADQKEKLKSRYPKELHYNIIEKFYYKYDYISNEANIQKYVCAMKECNCQAELNTKEKKFVIIQKHSISQEKHSYNGKIPKFMKMKNFKEMHLKINDNNDCYHMEWFL